MACSRCRSEMWESETLDAAKAKSCFLRNVSQIFVVILFFCNAPVAQGFSITSSVGRRAWKSSRPLSAMEKLQDEKERPREIRFLSPLIEYGYRPAVEELESHKLLEKPLFLYLPGFDSTFLSPFLQFPELSTDFDVRCMTVGSQDRSTFDELKQKVLEYVEAQLRVDEESSGTSNLHEEEVVLAADQRCGSAGSSRILPNLFHLGRKQTSTQQHVPVPRPLYIAGESFGGILASEVALSILEDGRFNLKGLTLINSATCYDRSIFAAQGPAVADLPIWLYPAGLLKLLPLFTDRYSMQQLMLILQSKALPSVIDNPTREAYLGRVAFSLPFVIPVLSQGTLRWRFSEWLDKGCARMNSRLYDLKNKFPDFRTLVIAGEEDGTLPSIDEAERLSSILPNPKIHVVEGAGHASTLGSRVDLTALMRERFEELQSAGHRTSMKPYAATGQGVYFGMEPRYDGRSLGLSPLLYWNQKYYCKPSTSNVTTERMVQ